MAKVSLNKENIEKNNENQENEAEESRELVATKQEITTGSLLGGISGEVQDSYLKYPELKLTHPVGPLSEEYGFTPGELVLKNTLVIWKPGDDPINIIVTKSNLRYIEDLPYNSDEMPRFFNSLAEADAEGLSTSWSNDSPPEVKPIMTNIILIQAPEKLEGRPEFYKDLGGKKWSLALWTLTGKGFNEAGKTILSEGKSVLSGKLHKGVFKLHAVKKKGKKNTIWVPILNLNSTLSDSEIEELERELG